MSRLSDLMLGSARKSPYFAKDLRKAARANKFIGQGSAASSTAAYAAAMALCANTGIYGPADIVFVSSEGMRRGRFAPVVAGTLQGAYREIAIAMTAGASFVVDAPADRARPYNSGEREVAAYLVQNGYAEKTEGMFAPSYLRAAPHGELERPVDRSAIEI